MKRIYLSLLAFFLALSMNAFSQTNVFDDVIVPSPNHTYLETAILQEGLEGTLQNNGVSLTVFAPTDQAFTDLATAMGTDIAGLLALPNLTDILTYHVLGSEVPAAAVTNGLIATPLSTTNTLKMTVTSMGDVYVNQAQVTTPDQTADNGTVHITNGVVLPIETVVDIAIDNGFTSLTTAVITAKLLPALTNPLAELTVFAPTNQAFDELAMALGTNLNGVLESPDLADILKYHVLGFEVPAASVTNGLIATPLSTTNTLKMTVTGAGAVYVNQAKVSATDISSYNGIVHVLDAVVLPNETVVDIAIDNGFTSLTTAVVTAELLPSLTDPLAELTVFAPTNAAFDDLAMALETDLNGVLASPDLKDILLYHVVSGTNMSTDLTNGSVPTLNGQSVTVDLTTGVMINSSNVSLADLTADKGVVHVIDAVLVPSLAGVDEMDQGSILIYPNPTTSKLNIEVEQGLINEYQISDLYGRLIIKESIDNQSNIETDITELPVGEYYITLIGSSKVKTKKISKI